jgi:hypothetical protein
MNRDLLPPVAIRTRVSFMCVAEISFFDNNMKNDDGSIEEGICARKAQTSWVFGMRVYV